MEYPFISTPVSFRIIYEVAPPNGARAMLMKWAGREGGSTRKSTTNMKRKRRHLTAEWEAIGPDWMIFEEIARTRKAALPDHDPPPWAGSAC
jgi:hypothetical protein